MTRIAKGKQSGELWDRVKLENGIVGYVFQNYLEEVKEDIIITEKEISGIHPETTVETLINKIDTNYQVQIQNNSGKILKKDDLVGTGCIIKLLENSQAVKQYTAIMYGDVNGDGRINSIDLLVLQRHILEIKQLSGVFLKAGNIDKTGKKPSSVDLLKIQRHILGTKKIEQ